MNTYSPAFERAFIKLLEDEGGYVNDPKDPGGETKYGISKRSYPKVDIKNLTVAQAKDIYYQVFWLTGPYEQLHYEPLAEKVFNSAVNMGNSRAFRLLQEAVNQLGGKLVLDGVLGPKSIATINAMDCAGVLTQFRIEQANYYHSLVARRPSLAKFLKGWLRRAAS